MLLAGCKAESLGVDVPRGGPDAISQEDLSRDLWRLTDAPVADRAPGSNGQQQAAQRVSERLTQMHLLPAFGAADMLSMENGGRVVCQEKDGRSGKGIVVAGVDRGRGAAAATGVAVVVSLAKTFDVPAPPKHTVVFCAWPEQGGRDAYLAQPALPLDQTLVIFELGALSGDSLSEQKLEVAGPTGTVALTRLQTESADWHGTETDGMERVDFRKLEGRVADLYARVSAVP